MDHSLHLTAVVGGGPAGLCAALGAAREYERYIDTGGPLRLCLGLEARHAVAAAPPVIILEKNGEPGRKLLLSGSGQCNLTHTGLVEEFLPHYQGNGRFLKPALQELSGSALRSLVESAGVNTETRADGKIFPASRSARDVRDGLVRLCKSSGVFIKTLFPVSDIVVMDAADGSGFLLKSNDLEFYSRTVILCTGGVSYPATGSNGDGYRVAQRFGHTITPVRPALAAVSIAETEYGDLEGITVSLVEAFIETSGGKTASKRGAILFTANGLSGPAILDLSRFVEKGTVVKVNWIPENPAGKDRKLFASLLREFGSNPVHRTLKFTNLPARLINRLLDSCSVPGLKPSADLSSEEMALIFNIFTGTSFHVTKVDGFDRAMLTAGGVSLGEVSPRTMESRIIPGLFFAGEILDIDADSGGYNIQAACSTGFLAGRNSIAHAMSRMERRR
jgi:predicted Rossmann fold flavoprotein